MNAATKRLKGEKPPRVECHLTDEGLDALAALLIAHLDEEAAAATADEEAAQ
jgi:hypothetical protein